MRGRTLAILAITFGAATAFVFWLQPGRDPATATPAERSALLALDPAEIDRVAFGSADEAPFSLARDASGAWRVGDGTGLEADAPRVRGLFDALVAARVERAIDAETSGGAVTFGLMPAERSIRLTTPRGSTLLEVGRASPVGYRRYARVDGGPVLLVDGAIGTAVERSEEDYVERRLLPMAPERARRLEIAGPGRRLVLERRGTEWRVVEPFEDRADLGQAEGLVRSATAITVEALGEGTSAFSERVIVRVAAEPGGPVREARFDATRRTDRRAVERWPGPVRGRILEAAARDLERDPDGLRDTRVTVFSTGDVSGVSWTAGDDAVRVRREGEGAPWLREDGDGTRRPVETTAMEGLLDTVRWLRATGFEPGETTPGPALGALSLEGVAGALDALTFFEGLRPETVRVRARARPGVACEISRTHFDELVRNVSGFSR